MSDTALTPDPAAGLAKLREPFPASAIGKLPRVTCKPCRDKHCSEHRPAKCGVCSAYTSPAHIHLDYVGHAEVTDRLLSVDPTWTWEPVAFDASGQPAIGRDGNELVLWIRLTVCGVTRLGVGTVSAGGTDASKQLVSDALRNAAMRFGVALDLWAKGDLESSGPSTSVDDDIDPRTGSVRTTATRPARAQPGPTRAPVQPPAAVTATPPAVTAPVTAPADDDPFRPFDESDELLAGPLWARQFAVAMTASNWGPKTVAAVIRYATGGRTGDPRSVLRTEAAKVATTQRRLDAGELAEDSDGHLVEVLASHGPGAAA